MVLQNNKQVSYSLGTHKGQAVIYIRFEYDRALIEETKKLTGARWSQSQKACYVLDTASYRKMFGLESQAAVSDAVLSGKGSVNQLALTAFVSTLQLKAYSPNTIRTEAQLATHLHEAGTDPKLIQELLGHNDIKPTLRYIHVSNRTLENIKSPFDNLNLKNE